MSRCQPKLMVLKMLLCIFGSLKLRADRTDGQEDQSKYRSHEGHHGEQLTSTLIYFNGKNIQ